MLPRDALGLLAQLLGQRLGHRDEYEEQVEDGYGGGERHHEVLAVEAAEVAAERRTGDQAGGERGRDEAVGGRAVALVRHVGHVGEHDAEGDREEATNAYHAKVPHGVDAHERYGQAGEEHRDEQEDLAAPHVRHGADHGRAQEREYALEAVYEPVGQERALRKCLIQHLNVTYNIIIIIYSFHSLLKNRCF